jgi:peptidoglycan hydrolase-like protein with peptidoglycan-binding domain
MTYSLTWLPGVLESAGLKVAPVPGWEDRGRAEMDQVLGVMCHTTVGPRQGNMPSLNTLVDGRPDLSGPLAQLGLGRDGTYYVIAAGRCNHAGAGSWKDIVTGNSSFIGIEGENTGRGDDPWPAVQIDAYRRGVAALLKHAGQSAEFCVGHKEYALPMGRKVDPDFDMGQFRLDVAALMSGATAPPPLIPAAEPEGTARRPTLRRGDSGEWVTIIQRKVGAVADGQFGARTEAAVRDFQRRHDLVPDGIVGPKTWLASDRS